MSVMTFDELVSILKSVPLTREQAKIVSDIIERPLRKQRGVGWRCAVNHPDTEPRIRIRSMMKNGKPYVYRDCRECARIRYHRNVCHGCKHPRRVHDEDGCYHQNDRHEFDCECTRLR